jgi:hypothetical protein
MNVHRIVLMTVALLLTACGGATSAPGNTGAAQTSAVAQPTTAAVAPAATATPPSASPATTAPEATALPAATIAPVVTLAPEATVATAMTAVEATATTAPDTASQPGGEAVLLKALKAAQKAGPYRTTTMVESPSGSITVTGEIIPPDRIHLSNNFGGQSSETTIIGSRLWTKAGDTWTEAPSSPQITQTLDQFAKDPESLGVKITNVKLVGQDTVNGTPASVYSYDSSFGEGADAYTANAKIWIGVANGLPLKQESTGAPGGVKSKTTQVIVYDPSITIEPPVK